MTAAPPGLVLASASPRRRALLASAGFEVTVQPSRAPEDALPGEAPIDLARRLAVRKARAVWDARAMAPAVVLAADTVVALGPEILGKPGSAGEAAGMLRRLSGTAHAVTTGVAIVAPSGDVDDFAVTTTVVFRGLSATELDAYAASGEGLDKAGGYGIQAGAASFVTRIEGSYTNVVGLPLAEVVARLDALGVPRRAPVGT